ICETGDVLDPTCDETPASSTTLTLFSDAFSDGNALGWSMDPTWEIGDARSSNGESTGSGDPWSDATPTHDDNVAGTVLGGNIGGGSVIFSVTFSNLNDWQESNEYDWNTESMHSSIDYPWSGSGSRVAHADSCSNYCVLTLDDSINLSS